MKSSRCSRLLRGALVWLTLAVCCTGLGCSEPSPAEHFAEVQADTVTPHGEVVPDSVRETDEPNIFEYRTSDGSLWRVKAEPQDDGYRYGTPQQVSAAGAASTKQE